MKNFLMKLCKMFGCAEQPDIVEDMNLGRRTDAEMLAIFHSKLETIAISKDICFFDAFSEHIKSVNIDITNRDELEMYLIGKGMSYIDIDQLLNEYYRFSSENG